MVEAFSRVHIINSQINADSEIFRENKNWGYWVVYL